MKITANGLAHYCETSKPHIKMKNGTKNQQPYKKTCVVNQRNLQNQQIKEKKAEKKQKARKNSCWVQSGDIAISFTEQGQTEILFEAIEKINSKMQENEKFKLAVQQLARLGLGTTVNYIVYIEEDIPKKIVLKPKANAKGDEAFKFMTELSVPAFYRYTEQ